MTFTELCYMVNDEDPEAAEWLANKFSHKYRGIKKQVCLRNMFFWSSSPQGGLFWLDMDYRAMSIDAAFINSPKKVYKDKGVI